MAWAPAIGHEAERTEVLAGMLAHELRNPLASALVNLAAAVEMTDQEDPRRAFLARTQEELLRLRQILESCLALGAAGTVSRVETRLDALVDSVVARKRGELAAAGVVVSVAGGELFAFVDPALVARVLENLVDNAARAAARGGAIRIAMRAVAECVEIAVEDDGSGIDPALGAKLFSPFVSGGGGSGLGLFFVRQVVAAHDGEVEAGSSEMGGARLTIRLPAGSRRVDA
jgi:signal transduction histidine kinase